MFEAMVQATSGFRVEYSLLVLKLSILSRYVQSFIFIKGNEREKKMARRATVNP